MQLDRRHTVRRFVALAVLAAAFATASMRAQSAADLTPAQRAALESIALGRARTALLAHVRTLPLSDKQDLGEWTATAAELDRALWSWVRSRPRYGQSRLYSDGACEVDLHFEPEALRDQLLGWLADETLRIAARLEPAAVRRAADRWTPAWFTGAAEPAERDQSGRPAGWEDVSNAGLELARAAAAADAHAALFSEVGRVRLSAASRVREFTERDEATRAAVRAKLERAAALTVAFEPDQVAVATARLSLADLVRLLGEVQSATPSASASSAFDFAEIVMQANRATIEAVGLAPPPRDARLTGRTRWEAVDPPAWVSTTLTAVGRSPSDAGRDEAAGAARMAAIDALREQVEALTIQDDMTVAQFVEYHQALKPDIVLFLSAARPVGGPRLLASLAVEQRVELPLSRLWEIVRRAMTPVERPPGEAADRKETP